MKPYDYGTGLMPFDDLVKHLEERHGTRREVALAANTGMVHYMQHEAWGPTDHIHAPDGELVT